MLSAKTKPPTLVCTTVATSDTDSGIVWLLASASVTLAAKEIVSVLTTRFVELPVSAAAILIELLSAAVFHCVAMALQASGDACDHFTA
jgi:hypothetical protein